MKKNFILFLFFVQIIFCNDQIPAKKQIKPIAIINGTVFTANEIIEKGTITFRNGKIEFVGKNFSLTSEYEIIDASGKHIYPGLFSSITTLGLNEVQALRATHDNVEGGKFNPNLKTEVAVYTESELIPVTRFNGITTVNVLPQSGIISGSIATVNLDGWTYEDMLVKSMSAMVLNFPSMKINTAWWETRSEEDQKKENEKSVNELQIFFKDAKAYFVAKKNNSLQKYDAKFDAMINVFEKKVPLLVWAFDILQIQSAVAFAEEYDVRIIIAGGNDSWRIANLLKEKQIPVVANMTHRLPDRNWEQYNEPFLLPKKLYENGIQFCFSADEGGDGNYRNLPYQVGTAIAHGLPKDIALKSITLFPAQIFGVDNRIGSLEIGKDANLIIVNGDIFDIRSNVEMEFIDGKKIDLTSHQTMLYEKYKKRYEK